MFRAIVDLYQILGIGTVIFNIVVLILIGPAILMFRRREKFHFQFLILLLAIILLLPVIIYENLLFMDLHYDLINLSYSVSLMKFTFLLGIIAYFIYNLHLLSIEDFPTIPVSVIAIITGFAIGAMLSGARLDPTSETAPIYYHPVSSGKLFILSLMFFNLIGGIGFLISVSRKYRTKVNPVSKVELFAILNFFVSPAIIFTLRFGKVSGIPFNFIFLLPEIAFTVHLLYFLYFPDRSGYPFHMDILSLNLIDLEIGTVIGSYSPSELDETTRLEGMAMIAIDQVVSMFVHDANKPTNNYIGNYGDILFVRKKRHLISAIFAGGGKKIGKFTLNRFLNSLINLGGKLDEITFERELKKYLFSFFHKKYTITPNEIMFSGLKT